MSTNLEFEQDGERLPVRIESVGEGVYQVQVGDRVHQVPARRLADGRVRFELGGEAFVAASAPRGSGDIARRGDLHVLCGGRTWMLRRFTGAGRKGAEAVAGDGVIVAPMTGTVLKIPVAVGDEVAAADTVAVVSAMKMEHKLLAGVDGTVAEVVVTEGATVDQDQVLLRVEPAAPTA